jgi:hypothetical protein
MKNISLIITIVITAFTIASSHAAVETYKSFGDHKVVYSAFNSAFISPEIASIYNITRGKNKGLVNISVTRANAIGGKPAVVKGYVSNIMAQQQKLDFFEVQEGSATYYLAQFRFENEDFMTFKISVQLEPGQQAREISFQRTFYHDK